MLSEDVQFPVPLQTAKGEDGDYEIKEKQLSVGADSRHGTSNDAALLPVKNHPATGSLRLAYQGQDCRALCLERAAATHVLGVDFPASVIHAIMDAVSHGAEGLSGLTALIIGMIVVAVVLVTAILLQSGYSAGISGAIGGIGNQSSGKKKGTDEFLERVSWVLGAVFVVLTAISNRFWH